MDEGRFPGSPVITTVALLVTCSALSGQSSQPESAPAAHTPWIQKLMEQDTLTGRWFGLGRSLEDEGFKIELFYNQQFQQNFRGGLETHNGHRLSGSYDLNLLVDFEKLKIARGLTFFMETKGTWSDGINPDKVGALFNVNSDAGGDHAIFIKKWWFKQFLFDQRLELRAGMLETNKDLFDVSLYANHEDKDFLNRGSLRNATIPHRTGLGLFAKLMPLDWVYVQAAVIDAQSRDRRTGFDTAFHDEDWWQVFWEAGVTPAWKTARGPMPGRYRVGWWYDPKPRLVYEQTYDGRLPSEHRGDNLGFYLGFDQMIWKENESPEDRQGLGFFSRYGVAHRDVNQIANYWQLGASYRGLVPERDDDVFGFSFSQGILSRRYREFVNEEADRESVWEWYYQIQLTPWCTISPDLQIIQNPGGNKTDQDAIVGGVRVRIIF